MPNSHNSHHSDFLGLNVKCFPSIRLLPTLVKNKETGRIPVACESASLFLWVFQGSFCLFAIRSGLGWSQELRNNQTKCFLAWITPFLKQSLLWDFTLMCFQEIRRCINVLQNIDWLRCWYHSWTKLPMIFLSCLFGFGGKVVQLLSYWQGCGRNCW